ncbi:SCO family protein [Gillisia marina]|uniref:SCO family protein n=1 Tax=Gillisia marina TaxID=1167637 RepID=UPI00029A7041|nr:SCO family protein [Gillisia marina]
MKLSKSEILRRLVIVFASIAILIILTKVFYTSEKLPIINPEDIGEELAISNTTKHFKNHRIGDFTLVNQNGDIITQKDYKNKIYVVDFIFTKCLSICPIMTNNMGILQKEFLKDEDFKLLSIFVTPVADSVPVLKEYAVLNNVNPDKWNITTGDKKEIYNLAREEFFAVLDEGDGGLQDFIHTSNFILIDKKGRIRGIYDGTNLSEINRLKEDIKILKREFSII